MNTSSKQRQSFSFNDPTARSVLLAGDFTRWLTKPIPLHKEANGVWKTTASLAPGTYHYRFFVDGEWRDDPECKVRVKNPFGTQNDVIQVDRKPTHNLIGETTSSANLKQEPQLK